MVLNITPENVELCTKQINTKNIISQVAGENEAGQTLLVAAEGVEGAVEGVEGSVEGEGDGVMYVTREDGQVRNNT